MIFRFNNRSNFYLSRDTMMKWIEAPFWSTKSYGWSLGLRYLLQTKY